MGQYLLIATAVLAGNLITAWFIYGMWRASKIKDDGIDLATFGALVLPLGIVAAGAYLFT